MITVQILEVGLLSNENGLILRHTWAPCKNKFGIPNCVLSWPDNSDIYSNVRTYTKDMVDTKSEIWQAFLGIGRLKRDGYSAETSFRLSVNRTSPFESAGVSAHSATGSNAGLAMTCLSFTIDGLPTPLTCFPLAQASLRIDRPSRSKRAIPMQLIWLREP
jgi:hypothetical protein